MIRWVRDRISGLLDRAPSPLEPTAREHHTEAEEAALDPEARERQVRLRIEGMAKQDHGGRIGGHGMDTADREVTRIAERRDP